MNVSVRVLAAFLALGALVTACSDDTDNAGGTDTVTLAEWVDQFDRACIAATETLSDAPASMSDAEFAAFNAGAFTILAALKPPDDKADIVAGLVGDLRAAQEPGLDDDQIAAADQRILQAMTELGISEQCIGGVPG